MRINIHVHLITIKFTLGQWYSTLSVAVERNANISSLICITRHNEESIFHLQF